MLVLVKSAPDTRDGKRGVRLARDMAADIVFLQNGVYFARKDVMEGFCGTAYALGEDSALRGIKKEEMEKAVKEISYGELIDLMAENDKVVGIF